MNFLIIKMRSSICKFTNHRTLDMQIAVEKFSEATVGYRDNKEIAEKWVQLFNTSYFMVSAVSTIRMLLSVKHIFFG